MRKYLISFVILTAAALAQETGARYLVVTADTFYSSIQPLVEWKHRMGYRTKVVKLSQIGSTTSAIKSYVADAYATWDIRPEYLLLVGAPNYIPFYAFAYTCYSDNYYTNMNADIYNEILSGRLNVHNVTEAQTAVNKMLLYEKTPDLTDPSWFINACLIAREDYNTYPPPPYSDDSIYWSDIRHAKSYMLANGYNTIDTLSKLLGNNASTVVNRVNQGRAFVLYRGTATNNWYPPFAVDVNQTQNGNKLPIVLSITCGTLSSSGSPTAAEKWFYTGTPTLPRGAAGYFATTTSGSGIAHLRSAVAKGFFNGLFAQGKQTFGQACEAGRLNVYSMYSSSTEYRGFTTIGDPSMMIWTAVPKPLEVYHDSYLSVSDTSLIIDVQHNEWPVESALVCVLLDTVVYEYGYTNVSGVIVFNFDTLFEGNMHITVTAHNKIPYLDSIPVQPTGISEITPAVEARLSFIEASPNPFTRTTKMRYLILDPGYSTDDYSVGIYDASGRLVRSLDQGSIIQNQESVLWWDGTDNRGNRLPAGVYFVRAGSIREERSIPVVLLE
ncbi:hypothetical protein IBX73_06475 [candidate division WOR-3 bacterium]|nr:hypothetical protein [candidate division WOR-3 bacterium]